MKKHKIKSIVLKTLDVLPSKLGYFIYHKLQSNSFKNVEKYIHPNLNSFEKINTILNDNNISLNDKNIIEIGSGWLPVLACFLKTKAKVKHIFTYDINCHYQQKHLDLCFNYFKKTYHQNYKFKQENNLRLPDFLSYYPKTNIINTHLPANIDLVFSRFVLEHVTPEDLLLMHNTLHHDLTNDGYVLHLISPSDHRAYNDKTLSIYDFLKYSNEEWNRIQTKFDYHNRLRLPDYLSIFKNTGFEVVYLEYDKVKTTDLKYKKFKQLNIHSDFKPYSEEDLLAASINVLLRKSDTSQLLKPNSFYWRNFSNNKGRY